MSPKLKSLFLFFQVSMVQPWCAHPPLRRAVTWRHKRDGFYFKRYLCLGKAQLALSVEKRRPGGKLALAFQAAAQTFASPLNELPLVWKEVKGFCQPPLWITGRSLHTSAHKSLVIKLSEEIWVFWRSATPRALKGDSGNSVLMGVSSCVYSRI